MMRLFNRIIEWSILVPALGFGISFLYIACASMPYPYLLEWMEGQTIDVVRRVLARQPLYTQPTLEYVPLIYPPYYYYVTAFFSLITGEGFFAARLVSTLATLGTCWIIYSWLRRENAHWRIALVGACLFLATYRISGRWFDMSRVDSLFLFLSLAGLYVAVHFYCRANILLASVLLTAAFFTKQSALVLALPVLAALTLTKWRHGLTVTATLLLMCGIGVLAMNYISDGWFGFYAFTVPAGHGFDKSMYLGFWKKDIFGKVGIFFILSLGMLGYLLRSNWRKGLVYGGLLAGFIGASYMSRLHSYGYVNVLMPLHAALALMTGLALSTCKRSHLPMALPICGILILIELATLIYNPSRQIPDAAQVAAGDRFLEELASQPGDIFMPEIQYIQTRVGKESFAYGMAAFDILRARLGGKESIKQAMTSELESAIRQKRFAAIMPGRMVQLPGLKQYYMKMRHIDYPQYYVTGALSSVPTDIYVPKP